MKQFPYWWLCSAMALGVICSACTTERPAGLPSSFMESSVGIIAEAHVIPETPWDYEAVPPGEADRRVIVKDSRTIGRLIAAIMDCKSGPAGPCPVLPPIATVNLYGADGVTVMIISLRTEMGDMYVTETAMDPMGHEIGPSKFLGDMRNARFAELIWRMLKE